MQAMEWEGQRPSAPSTPTSTSSQSTGSGANSSREKIPPYKQLNPSPAVSALSKLSDEDLFRKGSDELVRILRRVEADYKTVLVEHSNIIKDVNRRFQIFVLEARGLKEINQKLQDDNQELRDLCCFLDDDRQRSRKLAREWQRFGRYTASVMHSEVAAYQEKLHLLEDQQAELLSDNMELKELCLFLDHERSQVSGDRDEGDGSSNSTMNGQEEIMQSTGDSDGQTTPTPTLSQGANSTAVYIRELEEKIQHLEEEKKHLAQRVERNSANGYHPADQGVTMAMKHRGISSYSNKSARDQRERDGSSSSFSMNKPEAVMHAMKVLQVHEELERPQNPAGDENLGDTEKAIVREMCNVVWRKLGDVGEQPYNNSNMLVDNSSGPSAQPVMSQKSPTSSSSASQIPGGHPGPPKSQSYSQVGLTSLSGHQDVVGDIRNAPASSASNRHDHGPGFFASHSRLGDKRNQLSQNSKYPIASSGQSTPFPQGHTSSSQPAQGTTYSQRVVPPSAHTAFRPSQSFQPSTSSSRVVSGPPPPTSFSQSFPNHTHQQNSLHTQPPQHQVPPPRHMQRVHPLHAQQGNSAQPQHYPRNHSASDVYFGSQPVPKPQSYSSSTSLSSHPNQSQQTLSSVPTSSYMFTKQDGRGLNMYASGRPPYTFEESSSQLYPKPAQNLQERRQTYLDDRD